MAKAPDIDHAAPALDVESILAIHRDPGGYVGFVRKPDPDKPARKDKHGKPYTFENLFSLKVEDLKTMFPAVREWLTHDSYFTVNAYYRAAPYPNKQTGINDVWRKEKHLQSLTACYADIDSGRPDSDEPGGGLSWRQAQHEAEALADAGIIPQPSIIARSGRGVYLFWLLHDDSTENKLPHAWPEKIELYKACNKALNAKLRDNLLPADTKATDAARVLRTPGSIHRKALRRVKYVIQVADDGKGFTYSLPELAEFLELPALDGDLPAGTCALAKPAQYRKTKEKGSVPLRSHGTLKLNALRAQDLRTIEQWRGGFIKRGQVYDNGHTSPGRKFVLMLYANFLRGSDATQDQAIEALASMAGNMKPAYPSDGPADDPPIETIAKDEYSGVKRRRWTNKKLCALLGIAPDIAEELDLKTIIPDELKQARDDARPLQSDLIADRQEWLRMYILEHPGKWTAQKVVNLSQLSPYSWNNRQTANKDLNAIGCNVRHRRRRIVGK